VTTVSSQPSKEQTALSASTDVTMYTTTWCGYCRQLKRQLDEQGVAYTEINIETTPGAAEFVMSVNGGNQTVPTLLFADGSTLTNPSMAQVRAQLDGIAS
jgi:mycoredoxin